jgi:hypothetical protein
MATVKVIELIGSSPKNFQEAAENALTEAVKTLKHISGMEVVGWNASVKEGKIAEFRAVVKVAFVVHGEL